MESIMIRILAFLLVTLLPSVARADDPVPQLPEVGDILPLHRGQPAPRDGLLVDPDDMLHIQQEYQRLQFQLGMVQVRDQQTCDLRMREKDFAVQAANDRAALRQSLWTQRQDDLLSQLRAARQASVRQWYESPLLWTLVGAALTSLVVVTIVVAR